MTNIDLGDLKNIYIETALEYVEKLSKARDTLSENPEDSQALEDMYIASHSLKGQSLAAGYSNIAGICSLIEESSRSVKEGKGKFADGFLSELSEAARALRESVDMIDRENTEKDLSLLVKKLNEILRPPLTDSG